MYPLELLDCKWQKIPFQQKNFTGKPLREVYMQLRWHHLVCLCISTHCRSVSSSSLVGVSWCPAAVQLSVHTNETGAAFPHGPPELCIIGLTRSHTHLGWEVHQLPLKKMLTTHLWNQDTESLKALWPDRKVGGDLPRKKQDLGGNRSGTDLEGQTEHV